MMMNPNFATKAVLCLVVVAALVATSMRSKDAFAQLRGPTNSASTGSRKLQFPGLGGANSVSDNIVNQACALNPSCTPPPAPAPVATVAALVPGLTGSSSVTIGDGTTVTETGANSKADAKDDTGNSAGSATGIVISNEPPAPEPAAAPVPPAAPVLSFPGISSGLSASAASSTPFSFSSPDIIDTEPAAPASQGSNFAGLGINGGNGAGGNSGAGGNGDPQGATFPAFPPFGP